MGPRGVRVCARWRRDRVGFENFVTDMGLPPDKDSTLDRKNPRRSYCKSNCAWVDPRTQVLNKRTTRWVTAVCPRTDELLKLCVADWARHSGLNRATIHSRLRRGWDPEHAVTIPRIDPGRSQEQLDPSVPF